MNFNAISKFLVGLFVLVLASSAFSAGYYSGYNTTYYTQTYGNSYYQPYPTYAISYNYNVPVTNTVCYNCVTSYPVYSTYSVYPTYTTYPTYAAYPTYTTYTSYPAYSNYQIYYPQVAYSSGYSIAYSTGNTSLSLSVYR